MLHGILIELKEMASWRQGISEREISRNLNHPILKTGKIFESYSDYFHHRYEYCIWIDVRGKAPTER